MLKVNNIKHENIYFLGLVLLAIGIPLSHIIMSVAQIILLVNWLFDKKILYRITLFYNNKPAFVFSLIFVLHLAGLFYTTDFEYAIKDLRTKIPLVFIPIIFASYNPLTYQQTKTILKWFVTSVLFGTLVSFYIYLFNKVEDIRDISIFISHIRFSLNICFAICILFYFLVLKKEFKKSQMVLISIIIVWLIVFLFILQSLTGIVVLFVLVFSYIFYLIFTCRFIKIKIILSFILTASIILIISFLVHSYYDYFNVKEIDINLLEKQTSRGNNYEHNKTNYGIENGNYIGLYICNKELTEEWNKRSKINIDSNDAKNQHVKSTLIRFLNSKGLRKDADGIKSLNNYEIDAIENGYANYLYMNEVSLKSRVYQILFEYNNYNISGATKGYSIIQRYELWKAAIGIIKENFWLGVGTGDMVYAYRQELNKMDSDLKNLSLRAHNQYLSLFSAFGILGFSLFIFFFIYPAIKTHSFSNFLFVSFFIIASLSMINEDTIETQAGVTFVAFFYILLLFFNPDRNQNS